MIAIILWLMSSRPIPLLTASAGDKLDDARLYLSNLLAADADPLEVAEARAAVRKYTRAVRDSRRSATADDTRLDREHDDGSFGVSCTVGYTASGPLADLEAMLDRETL
jgi:hypothetical protein